MTLPQKNSMPPEGRIRIRPGLAKLALLAVLTLPSLAGCPCTGVFEALTLNDYSADPDGDGSLVTARAVQWDEHTARISGGVAIDPAAWAELQVYLGQELIGQNLPPPREVDVFNLGPLAVDDRIEVTAFSLMEGVVNLTPFAAAALVQNATSRIVTLVNADLEIIGYPVAAPIVVSEPGDYYIVIMSPVPGDYTLTVQRTPGMAPPAPRPGVLLLQFGGVDGLTDTFVHADGQLITIEQLPPFDLHEARPDLPGQSERFIRTVRALVEYIYADYNVHVTTDLSDAIRQANDLAAGYYDVLAFTSASPGDVGFADSESLLGIEPTIDVENLGGQVGPIFIQAFETALYYDFNTFCAFWASVAAHEYGHAVGLWHVQQAADSLMTPSACGGNCNRRTQTLQRAIRQESFKYFAIDLVQDPDRYLARVLGRRPTPEIEAIRANVRDLVPAELLDR